MSDKKIKNIVIVGGGTAGWMAAAAFSKMLPKDLNITLIESDKIGTVGVGEATIPHIKNFNRMLGLDEADFMRSTMATFKLGIEFVNWSDLGESYLHPFGNFGVDLNSIPFHHYWAKALQLGWKGSLFDFSLANLASEAQRFCHSKDIPNSPLADIVYAYHFDAGLYAKYLRSYSEARRVQRVEGIVSSVELDKNTGFIDSVKLESGAEFKGDFFVDCSGFKGLLIEKALGVDYQDWSHWLPCDRAVARPCAQSGDPYPFTRSTAKSAGWQWRIPLQHRIGNGYVYCSDYCDDDQAVAELSEGLEGKPLADPNFIRFKTGRRERLWDKNCLSLGLSSGFLEPLESTSIHLIQTSIIKFLGLFPDKSVNQTCADKFNKESVVELESIRDFLILHYFVNNRNDGEFWRDCRNLSLPDSVTEKISLFEEIGHCTRDGNELFSHPSWVAVMVGQGLLPKDYNHMVDVMPNQELLNTLKNIQQVVRRSVDTMPTHGDYIAKYCAARSGAQSVRA